MSNSVKNACLVCDICGKARFWEENVNHFTGIHNACYPCSICGKGRFRGEDVGKFLGMHQDCLICHVCGKGRPERESPAIHEIGYVQCFSCEYTGTVSPEIPVQAISHQLNIAYVHYPIIVIGDREFSGVFDNCLLEIRSRSDNKDGRWRIPRFMHPEKIKHVSDSNILPDGLMNITYRFVLPSGISDEIRAWVHAFKDTAASIKFVSRCGYLQSFESYTNYNNIATIEICYDTLDDVLKL